MPDNLGIGNSQDVLRLTGERTKHPDPDRDASSETILSVVAIGYKSLADLMDLNMNSNIPTYEIVEERTRKVGRKRIYDPEGIRSTILSVCRCTGYLGGQGSRG